MSKLNYAPRIGSVIVWEYNIGRLTSPWAKTSKMIAGHAKADDHDFIVNNGYKPEPWLEKSGSLIRYTIYEAEKDGSFMIKITTHLDRVRWLICANLPSLMKFLSDHHLD